MDSVGVGEVEGRQEVPGVRAAGISLAAGVSSGQQQGFKIRGGAVLDVWQRVGAEAAVGQSVKVGAGLGEERGEGPGLGG